MMHTVDEDGGLSALLQSVDPGTTPDFDVEGLIGQGSRVRRVRQVDGWLAASVVLVLLVGVGVGLAHLGRDRAGPVQHAVTSQSPTPVPTTASGYLAAVQATIRDAPSVLVDAYLPGLPGGRLTVVVDSHGATGTLHVERRGTSRFVADGSHVYVEPAALEWMGLISAREAAAAHGRWISMIGNSSLNRFRTLASLATSLDDPSWPRPSLRMTTDPANGTIALLERVASGTPWLLSAQPAAPYRPFGVKFGPAGADTLISFAEWDAPMTSLQFPAVADVYDPSNPTP
jgi:hypothetical protein